MRKMQEYLAHWWFEVGSAEALWISLLCGIVSSLALFSFAFRRVAWSDGQVVAVRTLLRTESVTGVEVTWPNPYAQPAVRKDSQSVSVRVATRPSWPVYAWWVLMALVTVTLQGVGVARVPVLDAREGRHTAQWIRVPDRLVSPPARRCPLHVRESGLIGVNALGGSAILDTGMQISALPTGAPSADSSQASSFLLPFPLTIHGFGGPTAPLNSLAVLRDTELCGGALSDHLVFHMPSTSAVQEPILGMSDLLGALTVIDLRDLYLDTNASWPDVTERHPWVEETMPIPLAGSVPAQLHFWAEVEEQPVLVHLDTGAFSTSVSGLTPGLRPLHASHPTVTIDVPAPAGLLGVGSGKVPVRQLPELCVGDFCMAVGAVKVAYHARNASAEINLGTDAFLGRIIVVDAVGGRLWISPPGPRPRGARRPYLEEMHALIEGHMEP